MTGNILVKMVVASTNETDDIGNAIGSKVKVNQWWPKWILWTR